MEDKNGEIMEDGKVMAGIDLENCNCLARSMAKLKTEYNPKYPLLLDQFVISERRKRIVQVFWAEDRKDLDWKKV